MKKTVVILRGVSGSGKSTVTTLLLANKNWIAVSADYFFITAEGNYEFDVTKLNQAHKQCQDAFSEALKHPSIAGIVVDNTNTKQREFQWYIDESEKAGAKIISLVLENRHGNKSIHDVPEETLDKQDQRIRQSLKLK